MGGREWEGRRGQFIENATLSGAPLGERWRLFVCRTDFSLPPPHPAPSRTLRAFLPHALAPPARTRTRTRTRTLILSPANLRLSRALLSTTSAPAANARCLPELPMPALRPQTGGTGSESAEAGGARLQQSAAGPRLRRRRRGGEQQPTAGLRHARQRRGRESNQQHTHAASDEKEGG